MTDGLGPEIYQAADVAPGPYDTLVHFYGSGAPKMQAPTALLMVVDEAHRLTERNGEQGLRLRELEGVQAAAEKVAALHGGRAEALEAEVARLRAILRAETDAALAGAVVSKPTAARTTCRSGLFRARSTASIVLVITRISAPWERANSSEPPSPATRIMSP